MIDKNMIDPNALHFYRMLKEAGFSAYFVGGSVRDLLLGKIPKDFDIATNATPQQIKRVIPQGRIIGRRFRHVMLEKSGGRYEIVTFRGPVVQAEEEASLEEESIEEQQPSGEGEQDGRSGGGSERGGGRRNYPDLNQFGTAEQDAIRRDFTINALFYDPDADELVDYVDGKLDVDRRLIRSIGDSQQRMEEDPIRILRAIRHKIKLGLEYDLSLERAMRDKALLLEQTSKDRIREEFLKVCNDHSLGAFLEESRRLGLTPHIMPWFEGVTDEQWEEGSRLWEQLKKSPVSERPSPDLGLALMMVPLIRPLVLEPYKETLREAEKNYLPDMKYFLSCEPLRNYYLRNLRVSRAQTDHIVRTLFYYSRMSGLWLEQGPPRRLVGRLFQHPPALLAARMARLFLELEGKEVPSWITDLAEHDSSRRRGREGRDGREERGGRRGGRGREERHEEGDELSADTEEGDTPETASEEGEEREERPSRRRDREREQPRANRLPPPDQPMVWNGPLHAPVLRPTFEQEAEIRWARKNQTVRAYRPSGIPNPPTEHALLKSDLVYNYKPEIDPNASRSSSEEGGGEDRGSRERGGRRRGRGRGRGRDRERGNSDTQEHQDAGPEAQEQHDGQDAHAHQESSEPRRQPRAHEDDDDSIGNRRRPGEQPAPLASLNGDQYEGDDEDLDDNIGNRLDAPPTSGHVGMNGDGVLGRQGSGRGQQSRGGSGGGGGSGRRRGRRRGRRGGGGGQNRGASRSHHNNP